MTTKAILAQVKQNLALQPTYSKLLDKGSARELYIALLRLGFKKTPHKTGYRLANEGGFFTFSRTSGPMMHILAKKF